MNHVWNVLFKKVSCTFINFSILVEIQNNHLLILIINSTRELLKLCTHTVCIHELCLSHVDRKADRIPAAFLDTLVVEHFLLLKGVVTERKLSPTSKTALTIYIIGVNASISNSINC